MGDVEAQLHGRCDFVQFLPSGTRGAHELQLDLAIVNSYMFGHLNHDRAEPIAGLRTQYDLVFVYIVNPACRSCAVEVQHIRI